MVEESHGKIALKSPLTYALVIIAGVSTYFVSAYNTAQDASVKNCHERIDKLERTLDEYTRAVLFKDTQIKEQAFIIDSLKAYEK